jgi:hypothetical protein
MMPGLKQKGGSPNGLAYKKVADKRHPGAMFSGCAGGDLIVASAETLPGSSTTKVRRPA